VGAIGPDKDRAHGVLAAAAAAASDQGSGSGLIDHTVDCSFILSTSEYCRIGTSYILFLLFLFLFFFIILFFCVFFFFRLLIDIG